MALSSPHFAEQLAAQVLAARLANQRPDERHLREIIEVNEPRAQPVVDVMIGPGDVVGFASGSGSKRGLNRSPLPKIASGSLNVRLFRARPPRRD